MPSPVCLAILISQKPDLLNYWHTGDMRSLPVTKDRSVLAPSAIIMGTFVILLWVIEFIDNLTNNALDQFGIQPRSLTSLPKIFTAPFLHFGWIHLINNTFPLFVLGLLILISGVQLFTIVSLLSICCSGGLVWLISPDQTNTLGASGIVFGYLGYLLLRGFYTRSWWQILIALIVVLLYGSVLLGMLPLNHGVSWQAHLGGMIGGLIAARLLHQSTKAGYNPHFD